MNSPNLIKTAKRACRNCTWEASLWVSYLKVAEKKSPDDLEKIKDNALKALMGTAQVADIGSDQQSVVFLLFTYSQNSK